MRVTVRLMGPYKRLAGVEGDVDLELRDPTLSGLLSAITAMFPDVGKKLQPTPGKIEPAVRVIINDVVLQALTVDHTLRDGDRIAFVPIVGGGRRW